MNSLTSVQKSDKKTLEKSGKNSQRYLLGKTGLVCETIRPHKRGGGKEGAKDGSLYADPAKNGSAEKGDWRVEDTGFHAIFIA